MKKALRSFINRSPRSKEFIKRMAQRMFPSMWVSARYVEMPDKDADRESARLRMAWKDQDLPAKQRQLVDRQLTEYRHGTNNNNFDVMVEALKCLSDGSTPLPVLEIGCSSGYYSEVFEIAGLEIAYTGCDYSNAFIALARQRYPGLQFDVQDATKLSYVDNAFEVVISGGCLLHIPEYEAAAAETARVAGRYAIFHRTPVVLGGG